MLELAKEKVKEIIEKNPKKNITPGKQLDTIVYPPNKPHYSVSGLLMDYSLEKLFELCFLIGF